MIVVPTVAEQSKMRELRITSENLATRKEREKSEWSEFPLRRTSTLKGSRKWDGS